MIFSSTPKPAQIFKKGGLVFGALMLIVGVGSCASNSDTSIDGDTELKKPLIAVTTSILGDVVTNVVGDEAEVVVLMPAGVDPHNYQPPSKQISKMMSADLIVENGLDLEAGIASSLKAAKADGVAVFTATDHIETLANQQTENDSDKNDDTHHDVDHHAEDHDDEDHHDEDHHHDHGPLDPHFWHDPLRMQKVVVELSAKVALIEGLDADKVAQQANAYGDELVALNELLEEQYGTIAEQDRQLVTGHKVFAYLADRYDFKIVGSIVPSSSTLAETNAADLMRIANSVKQLEVKAIFTDSSQSQKAAQTVVDESGVDLEIVALHSESLTEAGTEASTYLNLMQNNADRIVKALNR